MFPKPFTVQSRAILDAAKGQNCTIRLPGFCLHAPETVVACHLPGHNKGIGKKVNDLHMAFGCRACHDIIDGRAKTYLTPAVILDACLRGLAETQHQLVKEGLIVIPDFQVPA